MSIFTEGNLSLFDDYANGNMTEVDRLNFKQQLSNQDIQNQFDLYLTIVNQIKTDAKIKQNLKERFKKIDAKQNRKSWLLWGMAASLTGIILILIISAPLLDGGSDKRYQIFK